jgi:hypothetical protein
MANATLVPKRDAAQTLSPPLPACGESSAAGGFPAVGDWRSRSVPKAYPEGEGIEGWSAVNVEIITN